MTTVPKLNYANFKGKSKDKARERGFSEEKIETNSSDLFSHMNRDNLKYIQNQIKQKSKKSNSLKIDDKNECQSKPIEPLKFTGLDSHCKVEEQKNQLISKQLFGEKQHNCTHTEGENQANLGCIRESSDGETNKLSYYDLISQAKSKRMTSLEAEDERKVRQQGFLESLDHYLMDLTKNGSVKPHPSSNTEKRRISEQREALITMIQSYKKKNNLVARLLQQQRQNTFQYRSRITNLEYAVANIQQQLKTVKKTYQSQRQRNIYTAQRRFDLNRSGYGAAPHQSNDEERVSRNRTRQETQQLQRWENEYRQFIESGNITFER